MLSMAVFNAMAHRVAQCDYRMKQQLCSAVEDSWHDLPLDTLEIQTVCKSVCMCHFVHFLGDLAPSYLYPTFVER